MSQDARAFNWDSIPVVMKLGTDPAAATECADVVPAGKRWLLMAMSFKIVCDANVANRSPSVYIDDAGGTPRYIYARTFGNITAGQTANLQLCPGLTVETTAGVLEFLNLPTLELPAGTRIRTSTSLIQAGDNYAAPVFYVREAPL